MTNRRLRHDSIPVLPELPIQMPPCGYRPWRTEKPSANSSFFGNFCLGTPKLSNLRGNRLFIQTLSAGLLQGTSLTKQPAGRIEPLAIEVPRYCRVSELRSRLKGEAAFEMRANGSIHLGQSVHTSTHATSNPQVNFACIHPARTESTNDRRISAKINSQSDLLIKEFR